MTKVRYTHSLDLGYFNPHIRKGCDEKGKIYLAMHQHFNPHIRKGCDLKTALQVYRL